MENMNYPYLLEEFQRLWNHRHFENDCDAEKILKEVVFRELKDEYSHPRVRKSVYEKFYMATKRIIKSSLNSDDKVQLLQLYSECLELIIHKSET